jgi:uncharacterized membrane protein YdcZ (DUF606 family)
MLCPDRPKFTAQKVSAIMSMLVGTFIVTVGIWLDSHHEVLHEVFRANYTAPWQCYLGGLMFIGVGIWLMRDYRRRRGK